MIRLTIHQSLTGYGYGRLDALGAIRATLQMNLAKEFVSVSSGSYSSTLASAADSIMSGFGANLVSSTAVANELPLPTSLGGVSVSVTDASGTTRLAPLFFVSPGQINYVAPTGTSPGSATVEIVTSGSALQPTVMTSGPVVIARGWININSTWPSFFTLNTYGSGKPVLNVLRVNPNGDQSYDIVTDPIDLTIAGDRVFLLMYGTGLRGRSSLDQVKITIGGTPVQVPYAGGQFSFAGLDQLNLELPPSLAGRGTLDLLMTVDGWAANPVQLTFK